ncbi:KRAB-A domain-containing protein 2 [Trichonephila clavipes]|nr:KRAB-A domain-containing protein 2 [Trichonephila clavipes]
MQCYVTDSELFYVIPEAHSAIGHGGRYKILKDLSTKYKNVTRYDIELYIHLCEPAEKTEKLFKKNIVGKFMIFSECQYSGTCNDWESFYRLAISEGLLKQLYAKSQFTLCSKNLLRVKDIPDHEILLLSVEIAHSSGGGVGFVKCMCKTK